MSPTQISEKTSSEFSKCEERSRLIDRGKKLTPGQKTDATIKGTIERALWNDDVLRAIEASDIEVHVKDRVVHLEGHIASTTSQRRIQNVIRAMPGIVGIQNNLIMDDRLTLAVAGSLGTLEHTYGCKFFTGASHGVVSLSGMVSDENVKLLAEKCVTSNPNVRAVINNVHVLGAAQKLQEQPFLQPIVGQTIYFLDGISGVVKQVIINPNNRRVVAMTVWGQFADRRRDLKSLKNNEARSPERLIVLSMDLVRYMTKVSGFLHINSTERTRYIDFDPARFSTPKIGWRAPYPYCPDDVRFPVEKQQIEYQILDPLPQPSVVVTLQEQALWEQLANENLGG